MGYSYEPLKIDNIKRRNIYIYIKRKQKKIAWFQAVSIHNNIVSFTFYAIYEALIDG